MTSVMLRMTIQDVDNLFQEYLRKFHLSAVVYVNESAVQKLSVNDAALKIAKKPGCLLQVTESDKLLLVFEHSRQNETHIQDLIIDAKVINNYYIIYI